MGEASRFHDSASARWNHLSSLDPFLQHLMSVSITRPNLAGKFDPAFKIQAACTLVTSCSFAPQLPRRLLFHRLGLSYPRVGPLASGHGLGDYPFQGKLLLL